MSKLTNVADSERKAELVRNDFKAEEPYNASTTPPTDISNAGTAIDISERQKELARNEFSPNNPYGFDKL